MGTAESAANSRNSALNVQVTEPPSAPTTIVNMPKNNNKSKNMNKPLNVVVQEGNKGVTINVKPNQVSNQQPNMSANNMAGGKRKSRRQSKKSKKSKKSRSRKH